MLRLLSFALGLFHLLFQGNGAEIRRAGVVHRYAAIAKLISALLYRVIFSARPGTAFGRASARCFASISAGAAGTGAFVTVLIERFLNDFNRRFGAVT